MRRNKEGSSENSEGLWFGGPSYTEMTPDDYKTLRQEAIDYVLGHNPGHGKLDGIEDQAKRLLGASPTHDELEELGHIMQANQHASGWFKRSDVHFDVGPIGGEWREAYDRGARSALLYFDFKERAASFARRDMAGLIVRDQSGRVVEAYPRSS